MTRPTSRPSSSTSPWRSAMLRSASTASSAGVSGVNTGISFMGIISDEIGVS
ncbi:MAG: hypothetical protein H6531_10660 [Actinobacteria bacterium]|nr:hypothetical protein [Actinomycetota bacterium]